MAFGEKLHALRKGRGWSQEFLAEKVEVSRQSVSKWESGVNRPDIDKLRELSNLFGVTLDELVNDEEINFRPAVEQQDAPVQIEQTPVDNHGQRNKKLIIALCLILAVVIASVVLYQAFKPKDAPQEPSSYSDDEWTDMDELRYQIQAMVWSTAVVKIDLADVTRNAVLSKLQFDGIADRYTNEDIDLYIGYVFTQYFEQFEADGLRYYADEHRLYYHDELVSYFEDKGDGDIAIIIWTFENGDVEVYTEDF